MGAGLAFYRDRNAPSDLFTIELDSTGLPNWPNRLIFQRPHVNRWDDELPAQTPDSQHLVYGAYTDEVSNLYLAATQHVGAVDAGRWGTILVTQRLARRIMRRAIVQP